MDIYQQLRREAFPELIAQCVFTKELEDPPGELLLHKIFKTKLLLQTKTFNDQASYQKFREEAAMRMLLTEPLTERLVGFTGKNVSSFCGSVYRMQLVHEFAGTTLKDIIHHKVKHMVHPKQKEVLQLIKEVAESLSVYERSGMFHGYIQPKNIMYDNRRFKLSDVRFLTGTYEYKQQLLGFTDKCYLSPELLAELGRKTMNPVYNYPKSEVFSIGLTALEYCLGTHVGIHNFNSYSIDVGRLTYHLNELEKIYDRTIINLIKGMLAFDDKQRLSISDLIHSDIPSSPVTVRTIEKQPNNPFDNLTSIKKTEITPISYVSLGKPAIKTSIVHWERDRSIDNRITVTDSQEFSTAVLDNQFQQLKLDIRGRPLEREREREREKERQTRPCPSPINRIKYSNQQSEQATQRSVNVSYYDLIDDIKIDAPTSLVSEFSRMDFKLRAYSPFDYNTHKIVKL